MLRQVWPKPSHQPMYTNKLTAHAQHLYLYKYEYLPIFNESRKYSYLILLFLYLTSCILAVPMRKCLGKLSCMNSHTEW